jgi:hypothetical protein
MENDNIEYPKSQAQIQFFKHLLQAALLLEIKKMSLQVQKKCKILDEKKMMEKQQELEKKYGLRPHKRLRLMFLYNAFHMKADELLTQESGGMYQ